MTKPQIPDAMKITDEDLQEVNTFNLPYTVDEYGWLTIDTPNATIQVGKRPFYCNRGRFQVGVEVKPDKGHKMTVDWADSFPRYFFKLSNLFDELNEWMMIREKDLTK